MTFDWLTLTPTDGEAGTHVLSVSVIRSNEGFADKVKTFRLVAPDGKEKARFTVVHKAPPRQFTTEFNQQEFY